MYDRAIKKLKENLENKGLKPDDSFESNNFDLFHFHIEAFENQILLNKFSTNASKSQ